MSVGGACLRVVPDHGRAEGCWRVLQLSSRLSSPTLTCTNIPMHPARKSANMVSVSLREFGDRVPRISLRYCLC